VKSVPLMPIEYPLVATLETALRTSPPAVVILRCVPAPAAGYTCVTYTFCVAHARGVVAAASLVHRNSTSAAPVVAVALGAAGVLQVGGSLESSREQLLPAPVLALANVYVKSCWVTLSVPPLTTSKVLIWKSPGSMLLATLNTADALGNVETLSCTVLMLLADATLAVKKAKVRPRSAVLALATIAASAKEKTTRITC